MILVITSTFSFGELWHKPYGLPTPDPSFCGKNTFLNYFYLVTKVRFKFTDMFVIKNCKLERTRDNDESVKSGIIEPFTQMHRY